MTNERFVSSHIEKTGGISMKRFFVDLYGPEQVFSYHPKRDRFVRADQDPVMGRLTPESYKIKSLLLSNSLGRWVYPYMRKLIKAVERPVFQMGIPEEFSVIHGHFSPSDVDISDARLVTVFREPLERTVSHYRFWKDCLVRGEPTPEWFNAGMSFEDFALSSHMSNFQSRRIGEGGLEQFEHVGATEKLSDFCRYLIQEKLFFCRG